MYLNCSGSLMYTFLFSINTINVFFQKIFFSLLYCKNTVYNSYNTQNILVEYVIGKVPGQQ